MTTERIGNWMQTVSGGRFYPLDPREDEIHIEDIAHALSFVCRFGGHVREFYSVAEHCVRVSRAIAAVDGTVHDQLAGLLHDAAEAFIGDMVWPLKQAPDVEGYRRVEAIVEGAIARKYRVDFHIPIVKRFDLVLLSTEKRDIVTTGPGRARGASLEAEAARDRLDEAWHCDEFAPLRHVIRPWSPAFARDEFRRTFDALMGRRAEAG